MKKNVIVLILAAMAAFLSACNSDSSVTSMSLKPSSELESSSSEEISSSSVGMSSSAEISSSSSPVYSYYYGETGKVCASWTVQVVTASQTYAAYLSMYQTCGDLETLNTGDNFGGIIYSWILGVTENDPDVGVAVSNEVRKYGSSLQFYKTEDGGLNYIYVEPFGDSAGGK